MVGITRCKVIVCFFLFFFCFFSAFGKSLLLKHFQLGSPAQLQPLPASQPPRPRAPQRPPAPGSEPAGLAQGQSSSPGLTYALSHTHTHTFYCFAIGAAMGNILNPKQHCFAISTAMGSILNPKQYCCAISSITTTRC